MTDASCLPRTIKLPMHRTLSAKTELRQTKAVGLFLPLPKGKLVATQGWMGKGARQKKYLAAFHCASQDWIALVYWQIEIISGHFCFPGFPGGPVVKTLSFHRRGCGFNWNIINIHYISGEFITNGCVVIYAFSSSIKVFLLVGIAVKRIDY